MAAALAAASAHPHANGHAPADPHPNAGGPLEPVGPCTCRPYGTAAGWHLVAGCGPSSSQGPPDLRPEAPLPARGEEGSRFADMAQLRIRHLLVAGGAGFLGSAFVRDRLRADPEILITVLDALRRAGAEADLQDVDDDRRFTLVQGDVRDRAVVERLAASVDATINFASEEFTESGVADGPALARTDIEGTAVLLEAARKFQHQRFLLVSSG